MIQPTERSVRKFMAEIDERELALRLIEAYAEIRRQPSWTLNDAWDRTPVMAREPALRQARAALAFMAESFAKASPVA